MINILFNPEVLRRLFALLGLLTAVWFFTWPVEYVYSVSLVDFQARQQKERWKDERNLPLEQYVARSVEGRLKQVSGPQWEALLTAMLAARGGPAPELLAGREYKIGANYPSYYYFGPDEQPMASVGPAKDSFTYLTMTTHGRRYYLGLDARPYRHAHNAPSWLLHPRRSHAWWPLLLGLAAYLFIPRRKKPDGALTYSRFRAQIMADVVGLLICGVFFALPLLVIPNNADIWSVFDFDGGWTVLTIISWVPLAGCGAVILGYAVWYASLWLRPGPDALIRGTMRGLESLAYADMEKARPYRRPAPRWLVWGLMLLGRGNPTAMGQALLIDSNVETGMEIVLKDGRAVRVMFNALSGAEQLPGALAAAGVRVERQPEPR